MIILALWTRKYIVGYNKENQAKDVLFHLILDMSVYLDGVAYAWRPAYRMLGETKIWRVSKSSLGLFFSSK